MLPMDTYSAGMPAGESDDEKRQRIRDEILSRMAAAQNDTSGVDQAAADDKRKRIGLAIAQGLSGLATADSASRGGHASDPNFFTNLASKVDSKGEAEKARRDKIQSIIQENALRSKFGEEDLSANKFQTEKSQFDTRLASEKDQFGQTLALQKQESARKSRHDKEMENIARKSQEIKLTTPDAGTVAEDKKLGTEYANWQAKDKTEVDRSIALYEAAIADLEKMMPPGEKKGWIGNKMDQIKGAVVTEYPTMGALAFEDLARTKQLIDTAIQGTLRPILGSQFAQAEGVRLMKNAFNPALGGVSIEGVKEGLAYLKKVKADKEKAFEDFKQRTRPQEPKLTPEELEKRITELEGE